MESRSHEVIDGHGAMNLSVGRVPGEIISSLAGHVVRAV